MYIGTKAYFSAATRNPATTGNSDTYTRKKPVPGLDRRGRRKQTRTRHDQCCQIPHPSRSSDSNRPFLPNPRTPALFDKEYELAKDDDEYDSAEDDDEFETLAAAAAAAEAAQNAPNPVPEQHRSTYQLNRIRQPY